MHFAFLTASLQAMIIHEVDMYTQKYSESASPCSTLAGARRVSLCVAVGWFALVAHGSGRTGRLGSLPTTPSVTLRVRGVTRTEKRVYLNGKRWVGGKRGLTDSVYA